MIRARDLNIAGATVMSNRLAAALLAAGCLLAGCSGSSSDNIGPTDPTSGNGDPGSSPGVGEFVPLFRPTSGVLPFPIDLYFSGSTDGTLNLPTAVRNFTPHFDALNALDGFSTTADITLRFSGAIDVATLESNVRIVQVEIDNATKATVGVLGILQPNVDYSIGVSPDIDSGGATALIRPLRPLVASTGATNNGYLVLVTDGVTSSTGVAATPDAEYLTVRTAAIADLTGGVNPPTCASISNATLNGVCRLTYAHLAIGSQLPGPFVVDPTSVVASWSFSTVATRDTLAIVAGTTLARPYTVFPTGLTTGIIPGLPGIVDLYAGTLNIDYRLAIPDTTTSRSVMEQPWQAAGPSPSPLIDPESRNLTRFNPVPASGTSIDIPLLLGVPNIMAKPPAGWPIVIFVHGFPRDRTDALLVSDTMASRGFATIAIDMPLHGVTPSSAQYAQPFATPIERTFDLDLQVNGNFGVPGSDGQVDTTGVNFLNLANVLVQRDNSRQAIADIIALIRTIPEIDFDGVAGADFDPDRIHVIGYSLGGTHAGTVLGLLDTEIVKASALPSAAGVLTETIKQSATYGPLINSLLAAGGLPANTTLYRNFFRNVQAAFDAADTANYASTMAGAAAGGRELYFSTFEGGAGGFPSDPVVPVNATKRLIDTVGGTGVTRVNSVGATNVAGTNGGWVPFSQGIHNSLLDPGPSAAVTIELQSEIADFFFTGGDQIIITDGTVIQP
jgi:pimeloyl-ACP methyl ester carboxylesterase